MAVPEPASFMTSWGCLKRTRPGSSSGLIAMMLAPRRAAACSGVSMRGWFVPGFWPMTRMQSARVKSDSVTVPLLTPMTALRPTPLDSWHRFEQSGRLFVPSRRTKSW